MTSPNQSPQPDQPAGACEAWLRVLVTIALAFASAAVWWPASANAARIKEVASVQGVRSNQLVGYGLVVGLDGTGDQSTSAPFTSQSIQALLQQMGVTVPPGTTMQLKNVAAVLVTAQLPAFAQPGQNIDVGVSSLGNAKSLRGGTLIATPLKGADGQIYALAQGNLIVSGAGASAGGSQVQINHLSAGRIPDGASVERAVPTPLNQGNSLQLDLNSSDFNTAREVVKAINAKMGEGIAEAVDGRVVRVRMPDEPGARVAFMADIENLEVKRAVPSAKVVINARTGSVVMNKAVTLASCAVAHGSLSVTISTTPMVSQPNALASGQTAVVEKSDITIKQEPGALIALSEGTSLAEVVKALNSLGATPQDLLAILQAIKSAGALNADLEVI
ncbi:MAG: flagellar basal body P-ring protein FlgI [Ideonella sp.]